MLLLALEVLRLVVAAEDQQDKLRDQYAYHELQVNDGGRSKAFDVVMLEGKPYRKLVEKDRKPLSAKEARRVEADMARTARERRRGGVFSRTYVMKVGRLTELEKTHDVTVDGNTLVAVPKGAGPYRHRIRFDAATHAIEYHEIEVVGPGSELKPGTVVRREFSRNGDGVWLLRRMEIDYKVRFGSGSQVHTYSNYRKFDAESRIQFEGPK